VADVRPTFTLIRREFMAYFLSPIAYVVLTVFLTVTTYMFLRTLAQLTASGPQGVEYPMQMMLGLGDLQSLRGVLAFLAFWLVFLITPPLLTMRLFAEERSSGTLEMLLTAPLRDWQIVMSKFIGCFAFWFVMWLVTAAYLPVLLGLNWTTYEASIDPWPFATSYLGILLAGAMFLSLGLFISSLVRSQMVAALIALFLGLVFVAAGFWLGDIDPGSLEYQALFFITVPMHFERNFSRGLVDTRQLVLYISVTLFFLFLTIRSLESRRWH
jgi:ABC-2 type transport system permease protein